MSFSTRHIGPRSHDIDKMLQVIKVNSLEALIKQTIPDNIRSNELMNLPQPLTESRCIEHMKDIARKNKNYRSYIGLGYYNTILPGVIQRNILENPGWYTAYTPYQAEIAQGRLEALFNFQTMVCELTSMEIANASLLDEGTAAAEAMLMLFNSRTRTQKKDEVNKLNVLATSFDDLLNISPWPRLIIQFSLSSMAWFHNIRIESIDLSYLNIGPDILLLPKIISQQKTLPPKMRPPFWPTIQIL